MLGRHGGRTDHHLGAVGAQHVDLFGRHLVAHHEDALVTPLRRDDGEADARVAAGWFDDRRPGAEQPLRLGRQDHGEGGSVLRTATGIGRLEFGDHVTAHAVGDLRQAHHGRVANQRQGALGHVHIGVPHSVPFLLELRRAKRRRPRSL